MSLALSILLDWKFRAVRGLTDLEVISAFTASFTFTYVSLVLACFCRWLPPERYNRVDDMVIEALRSVLRKILCRTAHGRRNEEDGILQPTDTTMPAPRSGSSRRENIRQSARESDPSNTIANRTQSGSARFVADGGSANPNGRPETPFESYLIAISDQHLVTGLAILITTTLMLTGASGWNERLSFHAFQIASLLGYMSCIIHLCALTVIRDYFDTHRRLRNLRAVLMILLLLLLLLNLWIAFGSGPDPTLAVKCWTALPFLS